MTSDEIRAAIERLKGLDKRVSGYTASSVVGAITDGPWIDRLIALLEQADPDTHMGLPVDADGEHIHIGDELWGYGYPNGGVRCYAIVNERTILVQGDQNAYKDWLLWDSRECRHYHKPTVEDVLREYTSVIIGVGDRPELDGVLSECASRIRELMADE